MVASPSFPSQTWEKSDFFFFSFFKKICHPLIFFVPLAAEEKFDWCLLRSILVPTHCIWGEDFCFLSKLHTHFILPHIREKRFKLLWNLIWPPQPPLFLLPFLLVTRPTLTITFSFSLVPPSCLNYISFSSLVNFGKTGVVEMRFFATNIDTNLLLFLFSSQTVSLPSA